MKLFLLAIINFSLIIPACSQRSENIDTLSRKEIKKLILSEDYNEARSLMKLHKTTSEIAIAGYTIGGSIYLISSLFNRISTEDETNNSTSLIILASSLCLTITSEIAYSKSLKLYNERQLKSAHVLRNDTQILKLISD